LISVVFQRTIILLNLLFQYFHKLYFLFAAELLIENANIRKKLIDTYDVTVYEDAIYINSKKGFYKVCDWYVYFDKKINFYFPLVLCKLFCIFAKIFLYETRI